MSNQVKVILINSAISLVIGIALGVIVITGNNKLLNNINDLKVENEALKEQLTAVSMSVEANSNVLKEIHKNYATQTDINYIKNNYVTKVSFNSFKTLYKTNYDKLLANGNNQLQKSNELLEAINQLKNNSNNVNP